MGQRQNTFFHSDEVAIITSRYTLMLRLLKYLKPFWLGVFCLLLLMALMAFLEVLPAEFTYRLIDHNLSKNYINGIYALFFDFVCILLLSFLVSIARQLLMAWVGQMAVLGLRMDLFSHLLSRNTHFFHRHPVGRLMTRVTNDVQNLNDLFTSGVVGMAGDVMALVAIVAWMFSRHVTMTCLSLGAILLLLVATEIFRRFSAQSFRDTQGRYAAIMAFFQEQLSGIHLIQMNAREHWSKQAFSLLNRVYLEAFMKTIVAYSVFFPVVEWITSGTLAALILYAGWGLEKGTLTLGILFAFMQQSWRFFKPIRELADRYNTVQVAMASSERIFALLDNKDTIVEPAQPLPIVFEKDIRFDRVAFRYDAALPWVVQDLSFTLAKHQRIAVVGQTGAGKSTLMHLLMRFYDVASGSVLLDGVDIRQLDLKAFRSLFGLVLQDVFLFSGTLEENILLGRPHDPSKVAKVLAQAQLEEWVAACPAGLQTQVGERGRRLSAGERQLLAFARMLYGEPQVLLLDEATANIDSETEQKIQKVIAAVSHTLTTFTVAHRLSTIRDADEIWVMDGGQIVERGSHSALMAVEGRYAQLVRLQFLQEETGDLSL